MLISSEKKILNIIQYATPIFVLITSFCILLILYTEHKTNLEKEISNIKTEFLQRKKSEVKKQVKMVENYIINNINDKSNNNSENIKKKLINEIRKFEYEKNRYIFMFDYKGNVLVHVNKDILGKNIFNIKSAEKRKNEIKEIIALAKEGGGYLSYSQFQKPSTNKLSDKTSYIQGFNDLQWLIGTGFYHDDMYNSIKIKKQNLKKNYEKQLKHTLIITIISIVLMLFLSFYFTKIVKKRFREYKNEIKKSIEEKDEYTKLLNHQSKMASIGEMLGNIAHQWRQPLTVISMNANNMKFDIDLDDYNKDTFNQNINEISAQTEYLSKTIDNFSAFFNQSNSITIFSIKDAITKILVFLDREFLTHNITINSDVQDINIEGSYNDFIQVLINILNNAKEAFERNKCKDNKYIFINTCIQNNKVSLEIKDNAGGISENIINRIDEPYITDKHQSKGKGMSLYMAREIISNQMNGIFMSENIEYEYNGIAQKGAVMKIVLPLCKK